MATAQHFTRVRNTRDDPFSTLNPAGAGNPEPINLYFIKIHAISLLPAKSMQVMIINRNYFIFLESHQGRRKQVSTGR